MDCCPPGSSIHRDSPGKNTGVGSHASSRGSSQPRDRTQLSCIAGGFFTVRATKVPAPKTRAPSWRRRNRAGVTEVLRVGSESPSRANAGQQHPLLVTGCHYTHTDTDTQTQTHRHTHTETHRHTHTQTHTHRHTWDRPCWVPLSQTPRELAARRGTFPQLAHGPREAPCPGFEGHPRAQLVSRQSPWSWDWLLQANSSPLRCQPEVTTTHRS